MDYEVQKLQVDIPPRVESGPVKFCYNTGYEDWTGLFLRGDNAFGYAMSLNTVLEYVKTLDHKEHPEVVFAAMQTEGLLEDLRSCIER